MARTKAIEHKTNDFWVVGVGASAGGLEALTSFVRELPEKAPAAFIIAQHLAPHSKSMMVELLARQTSLPIIAVRDRYVLKPGVICIIPPNFDGTFEGNILRLKKAGEETRPKPSVDTLFHSLASTWKDRAVGIILSGTGSDGAEGVRAIKQNGGIVLVQDTESAKYDGMPRAAQETGFSDEVMTASELGQNLFPVLERYRGEALPLGDSAVSEDLKKIITYLKAEGGVDFSQYKISTVTRRIEKRVFGTGSPSLEAYLTRLKKDPDEVKRLSQEMLISVTSFFRDTEAFNAFEQVIEKCILAKMPESELRIWVAGCATGEEAYSIAILCVEVSKRLNVFPNVKIFATDLDQEALTQARVGLYLESELSTLPPEYLKNYFEPKERYFEAKKVLREMIVFAKQNIIQNPPFVKLDLISCRNVMIYFDAELQQRVFEIFQYSLNSGGYLLLGKSENAPASLFATLDRKSKVFQKINPLSPKLPSLSRVSSDAKVGGSVSNPRRFDPALSSIADSIPQELMKAYKFCAVVMGENSVIYHTFGDLSRFLTFPTGAADFRLQNLLSKAASSELAVLMRKAKKENRAFRSRVYSHLVQGKTKSFVFLVKTFDSPEGERRNLFIVNFEVRKSSKPLPVHTELNRSDLSERVLELEQELASTREHLQTVVEELEISNEELQSLNEELSSTNEEMQASNEELETTNEELQSTNEELMTVNEELNTKTSELRVSNASLENIQNSIDTPLLVVDSHLKLLNYNSEANRIFTLTQNDLGRLITQASCQCEIDDFEEKILLTVRSGQITEAVCEVSKNLYQMRIHPNRDENQQIVGAVILFFNNTAVIRAQEKLQASTLSIRAIINGTPALISLKDSQGRYMVVNRAFRERYQISETQIIGKTDREIFSDETANEIRDHDLEVILKRKPTEIQETIKRGEQEYVYHSNRFLLESSPGSLLEVVGTVSLDITAQIKTQNALRNSESRYRAIVEDQAVFVCRHLPDGRLTFTNSAFCIFLGGTPESNLNRSFLSFIERSEQARASLEMQKLTGEHPIIQYETRVVIPHSGYSKTPDRWVRWIHRAVFNEKNEPVEYQAVGFDVTDLHIQTDYLLQKENLFTHVLEHTSDYLTVYKIEADDFVLESFNLSAAKNRSYGHVRLIGKHLSELTDPNNSELVLSKYRECVSSGKVITFEESFEALSSSRFLLTTLVPIRSENGTVERIAALSRDITHLKRVEQALREQKENSDSANQAKSDFLAAMSHELRTPLGVITGMSQLLNRSALTPQQQKYIGSIQQSSKVLLALIEDVLDLSKIEAGKLEIENRAFSLQKLNSELLQTFETQASQKGLKLEWNSNAEKLPELLGDQIRLKQVLINLVGNAIKFTEKGQVTVHVRAQSSRLKHIHKLRFEVRDTGVGIANESFHHIFNRFSQADSGISRKFGGSGLGLAICRQLVTLMGGKIGFESKVGEGSLFWFTLELPEANPSDLSQAVPEARETPSLQHLTVLAIDDNRDSLHVLEAFLKDQVKAVLTADHALQGIELLKQNPVDLVLMDIQMPGMSGLEAAAVIRSLPEPLKHIPILALTANAMAGDREKFLSEGMDDYLSKPVDFDALLQILRKWSQS